MNDETNISELAKDVVIEVMLKAFDGIARSSQEEKTREYAAMIAKLSRHMLENLERYTLSAIEATEKS